jgi:hypothetical protein
MASPADGAAVDEGLTKVATDVPTGTGYAELMLGADEASGAYARGEVGLHPLDPLSLFAFAQVDTTKGASAGLGAKLTFDL